MTLGVGDVAAGIAAVVLLLIAALLVAFESALGHASLTRLEAMVDDEPKARRVLELLSRPESVLNPLRLLIVILLLAEATTVTLLAARWVDTPWVVLVSAINICLVFVAAETAPRALGVLQPEQVAIRLVGPASLLTAAPPVRPLANALIGVANIVLPGEGLRRGPFGTPEDIIALADAALDDDVIDEDERDLIESVIEFGDTVVREVMVPRTDMTTIEQVLTIDEALEVTSEAGFSRVPVVGENIDDVVGLVYVKDLIRAELDHREHEKVGDFLRPAHFVPETKRVSELLKEMQRDSFHMSVAVDEYGGIAGLVTLEDLVEEIVGEIVDEYDVEEPLIERQRDGNLRVDGRMLIDELNDLAGLQLPEGDWDTVGGLVFDCFGRIPLEGESCELEGYRLRVEKVQGRRITRVLVYVNAAAEPAT